MLYKEIGRVIGYFLLFFSFILLIPTAVSLYYEYQGNFIDHPQLYVADDFFFTFVVSLLTAIFFIAVSKGATGNIYTREGIAAVVLIWFIVPAISALPFLTSGTIDDPFKAYFEMVSGYTTTGSTMLQAKKFNDKGEEVPIVYTAIGILPTTYSFYGTVNPIRNPETGDIVKEGVEALGKGLLFWRSFTQWLGGVGIVVLFVAILPVLGVGGKVLVHSEAPGAVKQGSAPRIKETAIQLLKIYLGLTFLQIITLYLLEPTLPLFESVAITFSTLSTGGFSTQNLSIAGYHSLNVEWVVIVFMLAGGTNFALYSYLIKGKFFRLFDPELLIYIILCFVFSALVISSIYGSPVLSLTGIAEGLFDERSSFREGVFQLISALTSTGFSTTDYDIWPYSAQVILLIAMFFGAMSGSTSGGVKILRQYLLFRVTQYQVESLFRKDHVRILKVGDKEVDSGAAITVLCFFLIVVAIGTLGTTLYVFDGIDLETAIGLTACMQNNTGMSFRAAGPEYSCAFMSHFSIVVSILQMIFGRLEYYAVLAMLVPAFWQKEG